MWHKQMWKRHFLSCNCKCRCTVMTSMINSHVHKVYLPLLNRDASQTSKPTESEGNILSVLPLETRVKFIFHNSPTPGWVPGRVSASGSRRGRKVGSAAPKQLTALMIPQRSWTHKCVFSYNPSIQTGWRCC